jgi:hypothetical protein
LPISGILPHIDRVPHPGRAVLGAVLIAEPFLFGYAYSGMLRYWHFGLGAAVFLPATIELRRDCVGDLDKHGLPHM